MSDAATEILDALIHIQDSSLYFSTTGSTPVSAFNHVGNWVRAAIPEGRADWGFMISGVHLVTVMARLGRPGHVVEAVLNHAGGSLSGIASICNRYDYES